MRVFLIAVAALALGGCAAVPLTTVLAISAGVVGAAVLVPKF